MVRTLERPSEGHAMRAMQQEELEGVLQHCQTGLTKAKAENDLRLLRLYSRQQDRAAAEILSRRQERDPPEP
jgi:hypothetical protein